MLTCCILTHNSRENLVAAAESASFADEIVVVDDGSVDGTLEVAEKIGAKVVKRKMEGDFSAQRNAGLAACHDGWVLFLDDDERVSPELAREITEKLEKDDGTVAYELRRADRFEGRVLRYGETPHVRLLRLAKKGSGVWVRRVHETWKAKGKTGSLRAPLVHLPHGNVRTFLADVNRYTDLDAAEFYAAGRWVSVWQIPAYPVAKFILNYVIRQGFRDGMPGMIHAVMMAYHSFLTRGKIWELQHREK